MSLVLTLQGCHVAASGSLSDRNLGDIPHVSFRLGVQEVVHLAHGGEQNYPVLDVRGILHVT